MVRCHLDYTSSVWSPFKLKYIDVLENVQRQATRQLPIISDLSYADRLKRLKILTLAYCCLRGDKIQCKCTWYLWSLPSPILRLHSDCVLWEGARGHDWELFKRQIQILYIFREGWIYAGRDRNLSNLIYMYIHLQYMCLIHNFQTMSWPPL